jgi:phosphatidate phosphatase APP1
MLLYKKYDGFIQDVLIDEISMIDGAVFDDIINSIGDKRLILLGDLK